MKKEFLPYYISRALLSALFGWLNVCISESIWLGIIMGLLVFAVFLYYLHSARYLVDASHPFFPLRRDERSTAIRNHALIIAVEVFAVFYVLDAVAPLVGFKITVLKNVAPALAVAAYFVASLVLEKAR